MRNRRHRTSAPRVTTGMSVSLEGLPADRADVVAVVELLRQVNRQAAYLAGLRASIERGTFHPSQANSDATRVQHDARVTARALARVGSLGSVAWHEGRTA